MRRSTQPRAVTAAFHLSGQVCTSAKRFYVVDDVHDDFVEAFAASTRQLRIGHGLDRAEIGPLVSEAARAKVMRLVDEAVAKGANVVTGGKAPPQFNKGWFYEPTILTGCSHEMAILREECFGPVAAICRVKDFDEAIGSPTTACSGWRICSPPARGGDGGRALEAGMVWPTTRRSTTMPAAGGWKAPVWP
jgi:acyl-CoA reductase-like NAD-dependent aldehyde dehydrogenase